MAYIDDSYVQQTNIGVYVGGLDTSYYTQRYVRWSYRLPSGLYTLAGYGDQIKVGASSSTVFNIGGLQPGTTYIIKGEVLNYWNDAWLWESTISRTTQTPPKPIPNPYSFSWNSTEQYALYNRGKVSTITYSRWNELVEQVRKTAVWYHGSDIYHTYEAKMTSGDRKMTAYRFNTLRIAIDKMNPDGDGLDDSLIATGKALKGFYFIRLSERYNSITKPVTYSLGTYEQIHNIDLLHTIAKIEDLNRSRRRD